jgi:hypothetical protein
MPRKQLFPRKKKPSLCITEVLTAHVMNGVANRFAKRYIVVASTPSVAVKNVPLEIGEEVLEAKEMVNHTLIIVR